MISTQISEAIILAGGFGTRLKHIVSDVPKPMAPINGTPFLSFLFRKLQTAGIKHIILSTGYLHEKIENFYGNSFESLQISYSQEIEPLGTGGAIKMAMRKVTSENVLVLNGDTFFDINFNKLSLFHFENKSLLTIALQKIDDVSRYGSVVIDETGRIKAFTEKNEVKGKGLINGGIYLVNDKLFSNLGLPDKFSFEKEVLEKQYNKLNFYGLSYNSYFIDIGVPEDYSRAQLEFPLIKV